MKPLTETANRVHTLLAQLSFFQRLQSQVSPMRSSSSEVFFAFGLLELGSVSRQEFFAFFDLLECYNYDPVA